MKIVSFFSTLLILSSLSLSALDQKWRDKIEESKALTPQIVALMNSKCLSDIYKEKSYLTSLRDLCLLIYEKPNLKKEDIAQPIRIIASIYDWVPTKTEKVITEIWDSYLKLHAQKTS